MVGNFQFWDDNEDILLHIRRGAANEKDLHHYGGDIPARVGLWNLKKIEMYVQWAHVDRQSYICRRSIHFSFDH